MPASATLRRNVAELAALAERDLHTLAAQVEDPRGPELRAALADVLPTLVDTYGSAAATIAADWYDELRVERAVKGRFSAIPAELPDPGADGLIGYAMGTATDDASFLTLVGGGLQKRIANGSRYTITTSSIADPHADGWQRVGSGECAFCSMLIGRGAVYSEASADFASHDHCNCSAEPAFGGQPRPVKPYTPSQRRRSESTRTADSARARAWMRDNGLT